METGTGSDLDPAFHNLTKADFDETFNVGSLPSAAKPCSWSELFDALKRIYCGSIGAEYMHITNTEEKRWLQQRLESVDVSKLFSADENGVSGGSDRSRRAGALSRGRNSGAKRFHWKGAIPSFRC